MTLKETYQAKAAELEALKAKVEEGDADAVKSANGLIAEMNDLENAMKAAEEAEAKLRALGNAGAGKAEVSEKAARTLGEHFVRQLKGANLGKRFAFSASAFKSDPTYYNIQKEQTVGNYPVGSITDDYRVVESARAALQIRDLFDAQTISTAAYSFFTEGTPDPSKLPGATDEAAKKVGVEYTPAVATLVPLIKIAGYIKESDEFISDYPFLASAINGRLLYDLRASIQAYLVTTLLGTTGIQADSTSWDLSTTVTGLADLILDAIMDVQAVSGRAADAVVMNPTDWYSLRIGKDGESRYYGGGYFQDGLTPTIWGLPVVVTASIAAGTILVGAFKQGATVLSNGGTQVEMSNSNEDDFIKNLITIRAEERLGLAVRVPSAFKKLVKDDSST
jgi:HK97 family phage major capsid protein